MAGDASLRVGLDLIEIERIRSALERPRFRERCFTETERRYCDSRANPAQSYAARFAGKEAVGKALGCGVHFTWREIEVVGRPKPKVTLSGRTKAFADRIGAGAQGESDVSIMEIVGGTDGNVVHSIRLRTTPELFNMSVESLELLEICDIEEIFIQHSD